jgi:hypothetical protein
MFVVSSQLAAKFKVKQLKNRENLKYLLKKKKKHISL